MSCKEFHPKTGSQCKYSTNCDDNDRQHISQDGNYWRTKKSDCICNGYGYSSLGTGQKSSCKIHQ